VGGAAGLAPAARLLAMWWSPPDPGELDRWAGCWEAAGDVAGELRAAVDDALREEYERLFVGPGRPPCPPYESMWLTDQPRREQGRLMAACAADVARIYGELGLQVRADAHELPDHVVVELEALAYALEHGAAEAAHALAVDHLAVWMPSFCAAVGAETEHPFYAALARLTPDWVAALSA